MPFRQSLTELFRCRICLQVSLIVCFSILLVEAAILIPSYLRLQNTQLDRLGAEALRDVTIILNDHEHHDLDDILQDAEARLTGSHVVGLSVYSGSGRLLSSVGEVPRLAFDGAGRQTSPDNAVVVDDRLEVVLESHETALPFAVVARLDTSDAQEELRAFVKRVGALVAIIALFVSGVTIGTIRVLVLRPLLQIRNNLFGAQQNPTHSERYRIETTRNDEIGDMVGTMNTLLERLSSSHRSELLEREQRTKDYADASSDWFWEMDENLRFSYFSDRFTEVTGVDQKLLLGRTRQETGIPSVDPEAWEEHLHNLRHHRPFRNFVHPRTMADGTVVWLSINGKPIFDEQGNFKGYRGAGSDITRLKQAEEQLANKTAKIESQAARLEEALKSQIEYNNLQREFVSMASHEFRTPLTIIDTAAQRMARKAEEHAPDDLRERVEIIRDAVKRLVVMIESTLDSARAEAGKIDFHPHRLGVEDLVTSVINRIQDIAPTHRIAVTLDGAPEEITGDPGLLEQVLTNLLSNAVKYSPADSEIEVTAGTCGGDLEISVRDHGVGIPSDEIPKLFQKYFRASTSTGIAGTGLGLYLIRRLVKLHGGSIGVESTKGEGSTFTLCLPVEGAPPAESGAEARPAVAAARG